jgi:hypothetical protein
MNPALYAHMNNKRKMKKKINEKRTKKKKGFLSYSTYKSHPSCHTMVTSNIESSMITLFTPHRGKQSFPMVLWGKNELVISPLSYRLCITYEKYQLYHT